MLRKALPNLISPLENDYPRKVTPADRGYKRLTEIIFEKTLFWGSNEQGSFVLPLLI